jgi:hypothetical protein
MAPGLEGSHRCGAGAAAMVTTSSSRRTRRSRARPRPWWRPRRCPWRPGPMVRMPARRCARKRMHPARRGLARSASRPRSRRSCRRAGRCLWPPHSIRAPARSPHIFHGHRSSLRQDAQPPHLPGRPGKCLWDVSILRLPTRVTRLAAVRVLDADQWESVWTSSRGRSVRSATFAGDMPSASRRRAISSWLARRPSC